jgi:hypothetical protein
MITTIFVLWCFTCDSPVAVGNFHSITTCEIERKAAVRTSGWGADYKCIRTEIKK